MINKCIKSFFLFSIRRHIKFGDDLNGAIGACKLACSAPRTCMFIIFIMNQYYFTAETFRQFQLITVVGVLLGNNFFMMRKIITGSPHAGKQRLYSFKNVFYVFN